MFSSPRTVGGEERGSWYFEDTLYSFPPPSLFIGTCSGQIEFIPSLQPPEHIRPLQN